jgi:hypothetical protein
MPDHEMAEVARIRPPDMPDFDALDRKAGASKRRAGGDHASGESGEKRRRSPGANRSRPTTLPVALLTRWTGAELLLDVTARDAVIGERFVLRDGTAGTIAALALVVHERRGDVVPYRFDVTITTPSGARTEHHEGAFAPPRTEGAEGTHFRKSSAPSLADQILPALRLPAPADDDERVQLKAPIILHMDGFQLEVLAVNEEPGRVARVDVVYYPLKVRARARAVADRPRLVDDDRRVHEVAEGSEIHFRVLLRQ